MASARGRLASILGADMSDLTAQHIDQLVAGAAREDTDLDFKEPLYGNSDKDKREFAGDVAAQANTLGGALILGIKDEDGTAAAAPGVALSDAEELRMHQVLAANVAPRVGVRIHRVVRSPGSGFYVIEIPRSPDAPHAVRVNDALRYPRRDGARIRWLSENEVADAYRNRFTVAQAQVDRLSLAHSEGVAGLSRRGWAKDVAWLTLAVAPDLPGEMTIDHHTPQRVANEVRQRPHPIEGQHSMIRSVDATSTTGLRRVVVAQGVNHESGIPHRGYWQLHADGAGFGAQRVGGLHRSGDGREVVEPSRYLVFDEMLVIATAQVLDALAEHGVDRCGATGAAIVRATIEARQPSGERLPIVLTHNRGHGFLHEVEAVGVPDVPVADHGIDLDAIRASRSELLIAARLVLTDLMQTLGRAECWQITDEGGLRRRYFDRANQQRIEAWSEQEDVALTDEVVT